MKKRDCPLTEMEKMQQRVLFRVWDYFEYDASALSAAEWDDLMECIFDRQFYGDVKDESEATRAGFVEYVRESGGPGEFGLEDGFDRREKP